jgi:hypothetical protein
MGGFPVPNGVANVNVEVAVGSDRYCMEFGGFGDGNKYLFKNAQAPAACPECGNLTVEGFETCDPPGFFGCFVGGCPSDCTCAVCGDGDIEGFESCDPPGNTTQCAGNTTCTAGCGCPPPPPTCVESYPACDGTCPSGGGCIGFFGTCLCAAGDCVGGSSPPTCGGSCPAEYECLSLPADCECVQPVCGDGLVSESEDCDPPGNTTQCPGSLACNFDCTCPCPGTAQVVGGFCWYLGASGASCDATCTGMGLACDAATVSYAGSGGTDAQCLAVLTALGADNAFLGSETGFSPSGCCNYNYPPGQGFRYMNPPTTCSASFPNLYRACACQ